MDEKDTTQQSTDLSNEQQEIQFRYMKSHLFRVIHADGAWGGISPRGNIHMSLYNERGALPDTSKLVIDPNGRVIKPEEAQSSGDIIREVECDVVFDLGTAISLRRWLDEKIKDVQGLVEQAKIENQKQKKIEEGQKPRKLQGSSL